MKFSLLYSIEFSGNLNYPNEHILELKEAGGKLDVTYVSYKRKASTCVFRKAGLICFPNGNMY